MKAIALRRSSLEVGARGLAPVVRRLGLLICLLVASSPAAALPLVVTIGNGPSNNQTGDYVNAGELAQTLVFTSVTIAADEIVRVEADVDLSESILFGQTLFDLFLQAPERIELLGDLEMGAGSVALNAPELRLEGILRDASGSELDQSRLASPASAFVVGVGGSVQQASLMALENPSQPTSILVDGASDSNLIQVWSNVALELRSGFVENLTLYSSGSQLDWRGGQVGEAGLFGFGGTIRIHGSQFERGPFTVCANIPPSGWTPAPPSQTNVGACLRGVLASGEPFLVTVNFAGTVELVAASPPAPVPGPGLWILPALAGAAGFMQRRKVPRGGRGARGDRASDAVA